MVCNRLALLLTLGYLFLVACVPSAESVATVPATRAVATTPTLVAVDARPSTAVTIPPATSIITNPATATPTPISTADVQATITAVYAAEVAEAATLFAPTPTFTPSPTFTPVPGPIWPIFFRAIPCQDGRTTCDDSLAMDYRSAGYIINSDGSQLTPITDLGFPADLSHPVFSPDGTKLAYRALGSDDGKWHLFLANRDGSEAVDLGAGDFFDYQFLFEGGCLIGVRLVSRTIEGINLSIEELCPEQPQPKLLEAITLPAAQKVLFLPRTDLLLAYGEDVTTEEIKLFSHTLNGETRLLFTQVKEHFIGDVRWTPDGEQIEFITGLFVPGNPITTTFNLIKQDGTGPEVRLNVTADFAVTSGIWSPDGKEFVFIKSGEPEESGLYVLDFDTGEWRQILSHFYLSSPASIDIWNQDTDGTPD